MIYDSLADLQAGPSTSQQITTYGQPADGFDKVLEILPPRYRNKGREIVHYLRMARARLNDVNKLIYPATGHVGSSLYSLLKYSIWPDRFKGKLQRPVDYTDFVGLLRSVGASDNLYDASSVGITSIPDQMLVSRRRGGGGGDLPPMLP